MRVVAGVLLAASALLGGCAGLSLFGGGRPVASARALALQPDGKLVAAGTAGVDNRVAFALARYLPDGRLDAGFGADGTAITHFKGRPPGARIYSGSYARALIVTPDGRLVAAGMASIGGLASVRHPMALARYHPHGRLDAEFGANGTAVTTALDGTHYAAPGLVLQPDGKVVVAGEAATGTSTGFALARFLAEGTPDASFGSRGIATTGFGGFASARAVVIQPDGRLVAAGFTVLDGRDRFALARYRLDGSLDPPFGAGGTVTTVIGFGTRQVSFPGFANRGAFALARQPDGKLVAAGATDALQGAVFAVARYLADGSLDPGFGNGGMVATDFAAPSCAFAVALQPDGKVVVAGAAGHRFALARYLADGRPDRTFGTDGRVVTEPRGRGALALVVQPDGKLVAAGHADTGPSDVFALVRYLPDGRVDATFGAGGTVTTGFGEATRPR